MVDGRLSCCQAWRRSSLELLLPGWRWPLFRIWSYTQLHNSPLFFHLNLLSWSSFAGWASYHIITIIAPYLLTQPSKCNCDRSRIPTYPTQLGGSFGAFYIFTPRHPAKRTRQIIITTVHLLIRKDQKKQRSAVCAFLFVFLVFFFLYCLGEKGRRKSNYGTKVSRHQIKSLCLTPAPP